MASFSLYTYNTNPSYTYNRYSFLLHSSHCFVHYSQDLVSLTETSEFRKFHQLIGFLTRFCIQIHYSLILLTFRSFGQSSHSIRAQNRPPDVRLSRRGAGQGDEAHASGAEAHVSALKMQNFATEARAHVQRRTPLYRGATPLQ